MRSRLRCALSYSRLTESWSGSTRSVTERTEPASTRSCTKLSVAGVWVSAHPDTIAVIGTKDVLYRTRSLGWGSDVHRYTTLAQLQSQLPRRLTDGPRVVKRQRGNAGIGVWKVEVSTDLPRPISPTTPVLVHRAGHRDTEVHEMVLAAFIDICAPYFANGGVVIDQSFQPRVTEGLIRAYLVIDKVVGFSRQR